MRDNWVHNQELSLNKSHQSVGIGFSTLGNQIVFLVGLELEETEFNALFVFHLFVILG
jgi:hypothetical protein